MTNPLFDALFAPHVGRSTPFLHLSDGRTLTHDAFTKALNRSANALVELGVQPGDRVAVHVDDRNMRGAGIRPRRHVAVLRRRYRAGSAHAFADRPGVFGDVVQELLRIEAWDALDCVVEACDRYRATAPWVIGTTPF